MLIDLSGPSMQPIYERIMDQYKELIAKGVLKEGDKVPSVRELSAQLLVNPNTVSRAYQELERQGVITTVRGKGTFVADTTESPGMERERVNQLRAELRRLVVEAKHLKMDREQFMQWVKEEIEQYWGEDKDHAERK